MPHDFTILGSGSERHAAMATARGGAYPRPASAHVPGSHGGARPQPSSASVPSSRGGAHPRPTATLDSGSCGGDGGRLVGARRALLRASHPRLLPEMVRELSTAAQERGDHPRASSPPPCPGHPRASPPPPCLGHPRASPWRAGMGKHAAASGHGRVRGDLAWASTPGSGRHFFNFAKPLCRASR
jgi:hypothetical protein